MTVDAPVVVLDTDGSVRPMPGERRLALQNRQEQLRLGSSRAVMQALAREINPVLAYPHGTVFTGSGDFHHLSALLVARVRPVRPLRVIVLDNHPDNMRFPGYIHCGSWVSHVAELPHVAQIDVVGMTSRGAIQLATATVICAVPGVATHAQPAACDGLAPRRLALRRPAEGGDNRDACTTPAIPVSPYLWRVGKRG